MKKKRWLHKAQGTFYTEIGRGKLQISNFKNLDMCEVVFYQGKSGDLWVRPVNEFMDGRFIEVMEQVEEVEACAKAYAAYEAEIYASVAAVNRLKALSTVILHTISVSEHSALYLANEILRFIANESP